MRRTMLLLAVALLLCSCATNGPRPNIAFMSKPYIGQGEAEFLAIAPVTYKINETVTSGGVYRQYVFPDYIHPKYVYFENGKLAAMQN